MNDMLRPYQREALDIMESRNATIVMQSDQGRFLSIVRSPWSGRTMALPGGFTNDRRSDRDGLHREFYEEAGILYTVADHLDATAMYHSIDRAVRTIGARHSGMTPHVEVRTGQDLRTMLAVSIGKGTEEETFAVRALTEASDLLILVIMHLDAWLLSRQTVLAPDPGVKRYVTSSVLDRPRGFSPITMEQRSSLKGGRGSSRRLHS